ncbi:MAG: carboxypeptidase-like regulatory domain-containing protein [Tepidiformaceae bacterium]
MPQRRVPVVLLLAFAATPLGAQVVTGRVVDLATAEAVGEGFVVLLDEGGNEVGRVLTTVEGGFALQAPRPGQYRLRSERIGYLAVTSAPLTLESSDTLIHTISVAWVGVALAPLEVTARTSCGTRPDEDSSTATVWEEVRKALAGAAWTTSDGAYRYLAVRYQEDWDTNRRKSTRQVAETTLGYARAPFASRPAAALVEHGYVVTEQDSVSYFAPDAVVLQDDAFLATHCFAIVRRSLGAGRQVGLSFEPVPERRLPDVKGALWLDERTAELRVLEFTYTRRPAREGGGSSGGLIEFLKLPSGAWVVHRWRIRMPMMVVRLRVGSHGARREELVLRGFRDVGGDILAVLTAEGVLVYQAASQHPTR